ncbi:D-alanine--D-alanine ligase [Thermoflavimicrobium dichotomicum]|uniref:D-alanine--D-alanine ligase n=1 Tax=Thermoflavimicrobium dichotomicum TaxID=46223 RepID=A0A1I3SMM9_9BACL|nr:D-alanine--D-alanine ligase [Thermoflavimicrobium dichotomicum]SFJ58686.1 D-alanine-D-alanine ligase [Thermoflavimicrobium dichotomicum]
MKVGVIMGGVSSEREVSLMTGREIIAHLDKKKYDVYPIEIQSKNELIEKVKGMDVALLALHGKYGEDGTVQGTLETLGIPYTGSGVLASSLCMNKDMSKKIFRFEGIPTPDWIYLENMDDRPLEEIERLGYPVVVKPNSGGSSIGIQIANTKDELILAVQEAFRWDDEVIIEQYIQGDEITCAVLNGELLPIVSIRPRADFFDYTSKYDDGGADEQVIELPHDIYERVRDAALTCYKAMKCSVYARIDMMVKDGIPYVMEVNSLPGLTKNSLLPKSAQAAGISFSQLLDLIIESSLNKKRENK